MGLRPSSGEVDSGTTMAHLVGFRLFVVYLTTSPTWCFHFAKGKKLPEPFEFPLKAVLP